MILIRKRTLILLGYSLICLSSILSLVWLNAAQTLDFPVFSANTEDSIPLIIIDPGHGGEDGGAISCTGVSESKLNLEISLRLNDLLNLLGYDTCLIRDSDISIHTKGETIAQKKASDLKERVRIVNETENAVLLSIHQNQFPDSRYSGPQVFFHISEHSISL